MTPNPSRALQPIVDLLGTELRQVLHNANGFLDITEQEPLSAMQAESLRKCRSSLDRFASFVGDLTELAAGSDAMALRAVSPRTKAMLQDLTDWAAAVCRQRGVEFCARIDSLPAALETPPQLAAALYRIVSQRLESVRRGILSISAVVENGALQIDILDTGERIDPALIADMGGPLEQNTSTDLWLRVVRQRLQPIAGAIAALANTSAGVALRVTAPAHVEIAEDEFMPMCNGQMKLLVAEDSDESFDLFRAYLIEEGHQIVRARDGSEALALVQGGRFDLVVMDVQMPHMDGYTATRLIREWETGQNAVRTPIVLLSAETRTRLTSLGASVGCSGYLSKPISQRELIRALRFYSDPEAAASAT